MSSTIGQALVEALLSTAKGNSHTTAAPAVILWPDKESQWQAALPALKALMPGLFVLGPYNPDQRCGPAIWLKCAIAGQIPEIRFEGVPVIYLPGVSRADLRAIESCPRDLQPLAELQYRGVFFSQANARDWTLTAFLVSKSGGLGLEVAQDRNTQEALHQVLRAGVLLDCTIDQLQGRQINAEWLHNLLAPNPTRDLLQWLNAPETSWQQWGEEPWQIFVKRCKDDFGFDPLADGVLVAAERLAEKKGKWAAVAELYQDSYASFPNVYDLLARLPAPQMNLFTDYEELSGFPGVNEQREAALRYSLSSCAAMDKAKARAALLAAEEEHAIRRQWLWMRMKRSPLAAALEYLASLARLSENLPIGQTPNELATSYLASGWRVDQAALKALACVNTTADIEAVSGALRAVYLPWLEETAHRLQRAIGEAGGLPATPRESLAEGTCMIFVDGLRYDIATELGQKLTAYGDMTVDTRWTCLPSVTASGKAWCSPVAELITGSAEDREFIPRVAADGKPFSGHHFRKLLAEQGIQALEKHETGDPTGRAWTETGDLDHYGHEHGIRLAREVESLLQAIVERVAELLEAGWQQFRIVTDHGWLLLPGGLPKTELLRHQVETRWGRCAVLKDSAYGTPLTFPWDWCQDVQVAYAPGVSSFIANADYGHGGISLQECLVPVLKLDCTAASGPAIPVIIKSVSWKGLRCNVVVEGAGAGQRVDLRSKAALAKSSIAAGVKPLVDGKASLAVADDGLIGEAAVVVVLGADDEVLQKQPTMVGES